MNRVWVLLLLFAGLSIGAEEERFPRGHSVQTYKKHRFELYLPEDFDAKKEYSLVLVLDNHRKGDGWLRETLSGLTHDGYVLCSPMPRFQKGTLSWSTGEAKDFRRLVDHLRKELPIGKGRLHVISRSGGELMPFVAFRETPFVSVTFLDRYFQGPVGAQAKKRTGVLALRGEEGHKSLFSNESEADFMDRYLGRKVKSLEYRIDPAGVTGDYFLYWLGVMEGRFEPGVDLSFEWHTDPLKAKGVMAQGKGGFLYFYAKEDAGRKEAKALQNEVFFDPAVRAAGEKLVAIKLDRHEHENIFGDLGLTQTPAVVTLSEGFTPLKTFEGRIKARALAGALRRVAGRKSK